MPGSANASCRPVEKRRWLDAWPRQIDRRAPLNKQPGQPASGELTPKAVLPLSLLPLREHCVSRRTATVQTAADMTPICPAAMRNEQEGTCVRAYEGIA